MADNERDQVLRVVIVADETRAAKSAQTLDRHQKQVEDITKSYRRMAEEGEKLRSVGTTFAALGAAITAPMVAAAAAYAERYKGMESAANNFARAQQAQTDAATRFGRVAASALLPAMKEIASITQKVATFAEQHPDLVQGAANVGATIAAAGGLMLVMGQTQQLVGKLSQVMNSGGLMGNLTKAGIGIAAVAAGADVAIKGLNEIGKVTGDQRLATINMTDILKTGRQLIGIAVTGMATAFLAAKAGVEEFADLIATAARDLASRLAEAMANLKNALIDAAANLMQKLGMDTSGILSAKDTRVGMSYTGNIWYDKNGNMQTSTVTLPNMFAADRAQNEADFNTRSAGRRAQYNSDLAGVAGSVGQWAETGQFQGVAGQVFNFVSGLVNGIKGAATNAPTGGTGPGAGGIGGTPELVKAYIERQQKITASERAYNQELKDLATKRQQDIEASERQFNQELTDLNASKQRDDEKAAREQAVAMQQIDLELSRAERDAAAKFRADDVQQQITFWDNERKVNATAREQALRDQQNHDAAMLDFAHARDAAGALAEMRAYALKKQQDERAQKVETQERQTEYNQQRQERLRAYQKELGDLRLHATDKRADQLASYAQENQERQTAYALQFMQLRQKHDQETAEQTRAYNQQVVALQNKHAQEKTEIDRAFAVQIASLAGNNAGLSSMQADYYRQMNTEAFNFVQTQKGYLQSLYSGYTGGAATGGSAYETPNVRSYASGERRIPHDMTVRVHEGERITRAVDNHVSDQPINVNFYNNTFGEVATMDRVEGMILEHNAAIKQTLRERR